MKNKSYHVKPINQKGKCLATNYFLWAGKRPQLDLEFLRGWLEAADSFLHPFSSSKQNQGDKTNQKKNNIGKMA